MVWFIGRTRAILTEKNYRILFAGPVHPANGISGYTTA